MTLVAIAATAMGSRLQLDIYRTHLTLSSDELYLASQAVTFWGMDALANDIKKLKTNDKEGKLAGFPAPLQTMYPGVTLKGKIHDLQALFNINDVQDRKFHPMFFRLLENTLAKSDDAQRKALFYSLYYWISPYQPERGQDEYIKFYEKQNPPYLPAYQRLQNISELRLLRGVTSEMYQQLLINFTALPEITPININTASRKVLMSLGNGLSETQVEELLQERGKDGFMELKDAYKLLQKFDISNDQITIESTYYLIVATAIVEDLALTKYTVVKRNKDPKGQISLSVVSESLNSM
jgi:general secretion pathway protein K